MYINARQAAKRWGISDRRVRVLCAQGKVPGAHRKGRAWQIPPDAPKPADGRLRSKESLFAAIDRKKASLDEQRALTEGELERLMHDFTIENTYNSNAIEGSTLTLRETDLALRGLTVDQKPLRDHLAAVRHKEALVYIADLVKENTPLSESVIKRIHYLVLADKESDRGVYRNIPVHIVGAAHETAQPYLIEPKMHDLLTRYTADDAHVVTRLARFHIEFEAIHPFIDGNGRTGRLVLNLELMKESYPPIDVKYTDRAAYYDAFDAYHRDGNLAAMEKLLGGYIIGRLNAYLAMLGAASK